MSKKRVGLPQKSTLLRSKDDNNLVEALKLYEAKNYKKSLKMLDGILKKNSSHIDSLALKGLNLHFTNQKDEGKTYIFRAIDKIKAQEPTPIACHILGIYMRNVQDYKEAAKWFQCSLDNGSSNKQINRDLATLYSQEHDYGKLLKVRKDYWEDFMGYRANWTSLAIAYDLNGQNEEAVNILTKFEELAAGKLGTTEAFEHSECLMYKNDVLFKLAGQDSQKLEEALKNLEQIKDQVFDKYAWYERKAAILMKLGDRKQASKVYRLLIKRNPDDVKYYKLLEVALGITSNDRLRVALYDRFMKIYPRADPPKFIPLTFIKDDTEFSRRLQAYIEPQLQRCAPATFGNIKCLYKKDSKRMINSVENFVLQYLQNLNSIKQPLQYVWTCYFLAQHFLFLKEFGKAQEFIGNAIEHTPTLVEFYILKARIMKHVGLLEEAAATINEGRKLDLQDRFINTKTVKYFLRSNMVEEAVEVVSIFTKNDDASNGVVDLHLLEASWFICEQAEAYYRLYLERKRSLQELRVQRTTAEDDEKLSELSKLIKEQTYEVSKYKGLSLKRFLAIGKFYKQFEDDQLDFHSYCMRKGVPRAYMDMLKWGKKVFTSPMYIRAMDGAVKLYFDIFDAVEQDTSAIHDEDSNLKKNNKKAKKESAAFAKRVEEDKKVVLAYEKDDDILGEKLLATKSPLEDFSKYFYANYVKEIDERSKNYLLDYNYHLRCSKYALCLGSVSKLAEYIGRSNALTGSLLICLLERVTSSAATDEVTKKIVLKGLERHFADFPQDKANEEYDWLSYFQTTYTSEKLQGALYLYHTSSVFIPHHAVKTLILKELQNEEPLLQNQVLNYEL
ncbi:LAMI_0H19526g1_1 [Lachancea mirantina]|uniref:LAMI_0H19526g1_1 n=1 Tax=Lachancea mirantina TaxID=1230905 RepID=A0A1G4KJV8_9SACH|nr:LAMI_0H19526g1_1 [Lachancea mirantina]